MGVLLIGPKPIEINRKVGALQAPGFWPGWLTSVCTSAIVECPDGPLRDSPETRRRVDARTEASHLPPLRFGQSYYIMRQRQTPFHCKRLYISFPQSSALRPPMNRRRDMEYPEPQQDAQKPSKPGDWFVLNERDATASGASPTLYTNRVTPDNRVCGSWKESMAIRTKSSAQREENKNVYSQPCRSAGRFSDSV